MTSHATVMSIRPHVIPDVAVTPAPDLPAGGRHAAYVADGPESYGLGVSTGEDFWMYLQLRATPGTVNKCLTHLDRQLQAHPDADVEIVGIGTDQHTVRVIIGVNLGDSFRIKTRPRNVLAAYAAPDAALVCPYAAAFGARPAPGFPERRGSDRARGSRQLRVARGR